jgi:hypothetical protein
MSLQGILVKVALVAFAGSCLMACESVHRNSSPNYHINSMERMDKDAHYPQHEREKRMDKNWNKDK